MRYWDISALEGLSAGPQILSTTDETRTIAIGLAAGEALSEHQVHERAWVVVISGRAHFADTEGTSVEAGPGFVFEFDPAERHSVEARSDTRLVLLLAPWPGEGHPGAMTLDQKVNARALAAEAARRQSEA